MRNASYIHQLCANYYTKASQEVLTAPANQQLLVYSMSLCQREGSSGNNYLAGIGYGFADSAINVYSKVSSTYTLLDMDTPVQILNTTIDDGFVVSCKKKFGLIVLTVAQGQTGSPEYYMEFWDGSAWQTGELLETLNFSGETVIAFGEPLGWSNDSAPMADGGYAVRILMETAGGQVVTASAPRVAKMFTFRDPVQYSQVQAFFGDSPLLLEQGEYMLPYFSEEGPANLVEVSYKINP